MTRGVSRIFFSRRNIGSAGTAWSRKSPCPESSPGSASSNAPSGLCVTCPRESREHIMSPARRFIPLVSDRPLHTLGLVAMNWPGSSRRQKPLVAKRETIARRLVQPFNLLDRASTVADRQIALPNRVEDRILAPFRRGEAAVLAARPRRYCPKHVAPRLKAPSDQARPRPSSRPSGHGSLGHPAARSRHRLPGKIVGPGPMIIGWPSHAQPPICQSRCSGLVGCRRSFQLLRVIASGAKHPSFCAINGVCSSLPSSQGRGA